MKLLTVSWNCKYKIEFYCVKYKKYTKNINAKVSNASNGKTMILSKCAKWGSKKSRIYYLIKKIY